MAPSPTGNFHIGGVRTALFNYLFAKQNAGDFILRIDDTDTQRSSAEFEADILGTFTWLHLIHDEVYRQSERTDLYISCLNKLLKSGDAYEAEESSGVEGSGRVIRMRNPNKEVVFNDIILGEIKINTGDLGDFIIARNATNPLYHLANVVDDGELEISHIIRGQEHLANTPRQIIILEALGYKRPQYAHIPLILNASGGKLSKRDPETKSATEHRHNGILPEALINFLAFLGWNPGTEQEIYHIHDLVKDFNLSKVQKKPAIYNHDKLLWFNREYLNMMNDNEFAIYSKDIINHMRARFDNTFSENIFNKLIPNIRERTDSLAGLNREVDAGEYDYFFQDPQVDIAKLSWKDTKLEFTYEHLRYIRDKLSHLAEQDFSKDKIKSVVWNYAEDNGRGNVLWPIRYALTGREQSPDPFTVAEVLGREETLRRLAAVLENEV